MTIDPPLPRPVLETEGLSASYGAADVVSDLSLQVGPGEICAVLGPNGAGKTTLLKAISGLVRIGKGTIKLDGTAVEGLPPHKIAAAGVAHVPQGRKLFQDSTGEENLRAGGFTRRDRKQLEQDVEAFAQSFPVARRVSRQKAALMSGGEQQLIAIGRALMSRPRLLLLDEPSLGLAPRLLGEIFAAIRSIADSAAEEPGARMGVLLVEQNVTKALQIADKAQVLVSGHLSEIFNPREEDAAHRVLDAYLGHAQ